MISVMKKIFAVCAIIMSVIVFASCDTPEEEVFNNLKDLSERIETNASNFDADDWADAMEELDDIHYDLQYCDFTDEQWREIGYMEGRLTVIIAKEATKALLMEYTNLVKKISKYSRGFSEGVQDGIHEDITDQDIEDIVSTVRESYDSINSDWEDFDVSKNDDDFDRFSRAAERAWDKNNK